MGSTSAGRVVNRVDLEQASRAMSDFGSELFARSIRLNAWCGLGEPNGLDPEWTLHEAMTLSGLRVTMFLESVGCATHGVDPEDSLPSVVAATGV